jgi:predicted DNA-binding transcriptional regulator AlpA
VNTGRFPRPVRVGRRAVRWRTSDLDTWLESLGPATPEPRAQRRVVEPRSELRMLLFGALPEHRTATHGILDVVRLAEQLDVTDEAIYRWLRAGELPFKRAAQIVKIKGCRITLEDILPFVSR